MNQSTLYVGVATGNEDMWKVGFGLEMAIPAGMTIGAIISPNITAIKLQVAFHATVILDVAKVALGDPHTPDTPAGWVALLFDEFIEEITE